MKIELKQIRREIYRMIEGIRANEVWGEQTKSLLVATLQETGRQIRYGSDMPLERDKYEVVFGLQDWFDSLPEWRKISFLDKAFNGECPFYDCRIDHLGDCPCKSKDQYGSPTCPKPDTNVYKKNSKCLRKLLAWANNTEE